MQNRTDSFQYTQQICVYKALYIPELYARKRHYHVLKNHKWPQSYMTELELVISNHKYIPRKIVEHKADECTLALPP